MSNERLGNILLNKGLINEQQLDFCLKVQRNNEGDRIGHVLKHYDFINEHQIAEALAQQVGWDCYEGKYEVNEDLLTVFGLEFLLEHMVFPIISFNDVAFIMTRTDDMAVTDLIQMRLNSKVRFYIAPEMSVRQALQRLSLRVNGLNENQATYVQDDLLMWFEHSLNLAITKGATDIHIEPSEKAIEIRYRIDGILYFIDSLRLNSLSRLVNIVFHKADVTISDFTHFHDARFTHHYLNRPVDIRVCHIPAIYGSSLVLRLLDKGKTAVSLPALGYGPKQWELIKANLLKPEGITLIAGPTGCGKTTTLYAMLNHLKSITLKIVTIEDPVEMHLPLVTQIQMNEKRDITFPDTVRAFLRHDPNIILIGEIRDQQTAKEAIRAAMTGHKVFATIHANRPLDAILRLNDLGVPYTHLAGNLSQIITQRLVRRVCIACGGQSCMDCQQGYKGRIVAAEVLSIDEDMQELIGEGSISGLRQFLKGSSSYVTMTQEGHRLVQEGMTTIEEITRVLG